jgi:hypothetical protein
MADEKQGYDPNDAGSYYRYLNNMGWAGVEAQSSVWTPSKA